MSGVKQGGIDARILDEAAEWLMRLNAGMSDAEHAALDHWRGRSPEHARAWARAETLLGKLGKLPPEIALPALDRPASPERRVALGRLAAVLAALPVGWAAWSAAENAGWVADYRTAVGERREIRLADGSRVTLNTQTAMDVRFDDTQRLILLRHGQILIDTEPDTAIPARPFLVQTAEGSLQALGTRFDVRRESEGRTRVAVQQGAVRLMPRAGSSLVLQAGEQAVMSSATVTERREIDPAATVWTQGMLVADGMRLADFAAELARYRSGYLRVEPALAELRISGAYPTDAPERVLAMLASTYPLEARTSMFGYVVTLAPRQ
jgi:transmembrane sensor